MYKRPSVKEVFAELLHRKTLILNRKPSDNEIGRETKLPQATVTRVKNGTVKNPETPTIEALAIYFDVSIPVMRGDAPIPPLEASEARNGYTENVELPAMLIQFKKVPVVGEVKGGADGYLEEMQYPVGHGDGHVDWPTRDNHAYALRVRGDSMHPRYRAGEFVIVEPSVEATVGEDVIVCCKDGRKMLKVLNWIRDGEAQFLSINNGYGPLTVELTEIDTIHRAAGRAPRSCLKQE